MITPSMVDAGLGFLFGNLWRTAALALAITAGWQSMQLDTARQTLALERAEHTAATAKAEAGIAQQREDFEAAARAEEKRQRDAMDALAAKLLKEKEDAIATERAVADDLRAGTLRLRRHWAAAVSTAELARSAEAAARADEDARLREQGAAALVRVGADADRQVRGLQAALTICLGPPEAREGAQ